MIKSRYLLSQVLLTTYIFSASVDSSDLIDLNILSSDNIYINNGSYSVGNGVDFNNTTVIGSYMLNKNGSLSPFITGGFGYSTMVQDSTKVDSKYLKAGGGLRYNINNSLYISGGYLATFIKSDIGSHTTDSRGDSIFSTMSYSTKLEAINPYINTTIKYINFANSTDGFSANLESGFYSNELTSIYNLPIYMKLYVGADRYDKDLANIIKTDSIYTVGSELYWKMGKILGYKKLNNLSLALKYKKSVGSNGFKGQKVGVGLKLLKF